MNDEVLNFIDSCMQRGITKNKDIAAEAQREKATIELELRELENKRRRKIILETVVKSLGGVNEVKSKISSSSLTEETVWEQLDPHSQSVLLKILQLIESKPTMPRELMIYCNVGEKDYEVYTGLKWLVRAGYCLRNNEGYYERGVRWESRPIG
jgi:hypothetical protein